MGVPGVEEAIAASS
jgi:hypothetical protein